MKLSTFLLFFIMLQSTASVLSQTITVDVKNQSMREVLRMIESQTDYRFFYNDQLSGLNTPVTLKAENETLEEILNQLLNDQPFSYTAMENKMIVIVPKEFMQLPKVSGTVTDDKGIPLPGVSILIKGTSLGTITNIEGKFELDLTPDAQILVFSFMGMKTQEIPIGDMQVFNITLKEDIIGMDEVIVVGYGTMKKSDLTGSVYRVDASKYEAQHTTNIAEMLSGTVAGFRTEQGVWANSEGSMQIRGPNSLKANTSPLIVLDGVIFNGSIGDINPNDIETMDILKDASSAAVFGARAASGVILITTKRGQGKPTISFSSNTGMTGFTNYLQPRSPEGMLKMKTDYLEGQNIKPQYYYYHPDRLPSTMSVTDWLNLDPVPGTDPVDVWATRVDLYPVEYENYKAGKVTDWMEEIYKPGLKLDNNLSVAGSTDDVRYYWSLGYLSNKSIAGGDTYGGHLIQYGPRGEFRQGDIYSMINSKLNVDIDITDNIKIGLNLQYADRDESGEMAHLSVYAWSPYFQKYEDDGKTLRLFPNIMASTSQNPYAFAQIRDQMRKNQNLFATLFSEIKLPFGFSYKILFSNRYGWGKSFLYDNSESQMGSKVGGYGYRNNTSLYEWTIDNILYWNKTFADIHTFNFTFLANAEKLQDWWDIQRSMQFDASEALSYHGLQVGTSTVVLNDDGVSTANALMGRLNYTLMDKYLFTATYRRDGYSAFGQDNPYAYFPSFALGWNISNEDFFKIDAISYLKLRASWGENGNRAVDRYAALSQLTTELYIYGGLTDPVTGFYTSTMSNSSLKWERTQAINLGVDFGLFENRITGNAEIYQMTTTDLLVDRTLPKLIGYNSVASNLGELENKGMELTIKSVNFNKSNISWRSEFIFSFNRNKIIHLYGDMVDITDDEGNVIGQEESDDITNQWFIGESIDRIWDFQLDGVYQLGEEAEALVYGRKPGDWKVSDMNDDGVLTPLDDKVFLGYRTPRYLLGLRNDLILFRNFEVSAFIRADLGYLGANSLHLNTEDGSAYAKGNTYDTPYWTVNNPINDYGRLAGYRTPEINYYQSRSFVRLQDLSVAYNVPGSVLSKYSIQRCKLYLSFRNLLTITPWDNFDPESGTYPMPKTSSIGVNFSF